ncbi:MAG: hypothetical protein GY772_17865 [bacterium]|nr:hypothetical protein [bacterium]
MPKAQPAPKGRAAAAKARGPEPRAAGTQAPGPKRRAAGTKAAGPKRRAAGTEAPGPKRRAAGTEAPAPEPAEEGDVGATSAGPSGGDTAHGPSRRTGDDSDVSSLVVSSVKAELRPAELLETSSPEQHTAAEKRAAWMRFHRSRQAVTGRSARTEKCPLDIAEKMSASAAERNRYFDLWVGHSESWGQVVVFEKTLARKTSGSELLERWLTRTQLINTYGSAAIVDGIIAHKQAPETKRPHPEAPEVLEAMQYLCVVYDDIVEEKEQIAEKGVALQAELDHTTGKHALPDLLRSLPAATTSATTETRKRSERKQQAKEKKEARGDKRQDPSYRADSWLNGIGKDMRKASMAREDSKSAKIDGTLEKEYQRRFEVALQKLGQLRTTIETDGTSVQAEVVQEAEEAVRTLRKDIKAWECLKGLYSEAPALKTK